MTMSTGSSEVFNYRVDVKGGDPVDTHGILYLLQLGQAPDPRGTGTLWD